MPDNRAASPGAVGENSSGHSVDISVILCTFNRCQSLAMTLECVAAQSLPASVEWEVLVVDNNSADQTRAVVEDYCSRYPGRFRYLFEPQPGKSNALNAGIREARGGVLAFLDDDVTVELTWLQNLTADLRSGECAGAGGRILPQGDLSLPRWLSFERSYWRGTLALFDPGTEPGILKDPPFGTNMAFQRKMFEKYGCFRTDLGPSPCPEIPRPSEDTEFGRRLMAAGEQLRYQPSALVHHPVPEQRLRKEYFLAWWFDKGRSDLRELGFPPKTRWFVGGIPVYLFRRLAVWVLLWMIAVQPSDRFYRRTRVRWLVGQIVESRRWRRSPGADGNAS